jgi:hypothetical protein
MKTRFSITINETWDELEQEIRALAKSMRPRWKRWFLRL